MTTTANAIHQPRNFVPSDYECVGGFDSQRDYRVSTAEQQHERAMYDLLNQSNTSRWNESIGHGGQCDHCGAHLRYVAVLRHIPTGEHMVVGETCLSNRVGNYSHAEFRFSFIRTAAANARAHAARVAAQAEFVSQNPSIASLVDYSGTNDFFTSLRDQLLRNGSLSERQVAAYERSLVRDAEREAQRANEPAATPAPSGKVTVTGEVLSTKYVESDFSRYGGTLKMLVRDDRGFKVWVTVPSAITVERGDRVTFTATLEVSDRDECFAFGKRPTKAQVI